MPLLPPPAPIRIWNRRLEREETENVYGAEWVSWLYGTAPGQQLAEHLLSRPFFSKLYGAYQSSPRSRHKIAPFIRQFGIAMEEFEPGPFGSFNEFFVRKFRPGARTFAADAATLPAFAEARYLAYERTEARATYPVKGTRITAAELLGNPRAAAAFEGGPLLIARLCPTDYHRFHYPDDGDALDGWAVHGPLHSVNPAALRYNDRILLTNERQVSILNTRNFGRLAYVEVGALCVGKIIQTRNTREFSRGDEKGYFLFGASTVVLLGEPGRWKPHADLLERTAQGIEILIHLGEGIACSTQLR